MTPEDRELLLSLRRRQAELQQSLETLQNQLTGLEERLESVPDEVTLPPIPSELHHELPPLPVELDGPISSHAPSTPGLPPLPSPASRPSLEFRLGRWLTAIGAVFGLIALGLIFSLPVVYQHLGPAGLLGLSAALSVGVIILTQRLERRGGGLLILARTIMAMALGWLYLTAYAAGFDSHLQVIANPVLAGLLLLLWSAYVLIMAERKKSQILSIFAIALAYFGTAINPVGRFTMAADLLLAGTAVIFLLRNGWAALSFLCLFGTYFAFLRRLLMDENGDIVLATSRTLSFAPYVVYLLGAWVIFSAAVLLCTAPSFRGAKRILFLSLNNAAMAGLLVLTTYIAGYEYGAMGRSLLWASALLVGISACARMTGEDPTQATDVARAYLTQGVALFTGGVLVVYTGITRGVLLLVETFLIGSAAAISRSRLAAICGAVAAFFATTCLVWEIAVNAHSPWRLGLGGAAVMLLNAWWARGTVSRGRRELVVVSSYYCVLALGLVFAAMSTELSDSALPPELAIVALILTLSIYLIPLFELPPVAQTFLLGAQALVLFPTETGEALPWWSTAVVAAVTLVVIAWWPRQRVTPFGPWMHGLNLVYALTLVGLTYHAVRPYADLQGWMMSASLLSIGFLFFAAFSRVWSLGIMGQAFLAVAVYHFFFPVSLPAGDFGPWWAAAVPLTAVFATARATHQWLRVNPELGENRRHALRGLAYGYQALALIMLIRWVLGVVPANGHVATFLFLGALLLGWSVREGSPFGARCSFVLSLAGLVLFVEKFHSGGAALVTGLNGLALLCLLAEAAVLRHAAKVLVSSMENWAVLLLSVAAGWLFVSEAVVVRLQPHDLTMGWAFYALFLFLFGLLVWEQRLRWCGLAILVMAIIRVGCYDFWGFSSGYRVLTFLVLTVITLGLGYVYARFGDQLRNWL